MDIAHFMQTNILGDMKFPETMYNLIGNYLVGDFPQLQILLLDPTIHSRKDPLVGVGLSKSIVALLEYPLMCSHINLDIFVGN